MLPNIILKYFPNTVAAFTFCPVGKRTTGTSFTTNGLAVIAAIVIKTEEPISKNIRRILNIIRRLRGDFTIDRV